jgi:hypothetical protein
MQAVAHVRESTQVSVDAFEEAAVQTTRRMGSLWFGGVRVFVCIEAHLALRTENTAGGQFTQPPNYPKDYNRVGAEYTTFCGIHERLTFEMAPAMRPSVDIDCQTELYDD